MLFKSISVQAVCVSIPLYGFVQLIDDGLKNSLMGGDVGAVEAGSEERQGSTLSITPWLQARTHTHTLL